MENLEIPHDELLMFLPACIISDVLELSPQPLRKLVATRPNEPTRLHCEVSLSRVFEVLKVQDDLEREISKLKTEDFSLFAALKKEKIFEQAEKEIQKYLSASSGRGIQCAS